MRERKEKMLGIVICMKLFRTFLLLNALLLASSPLFTAFAVDKSVISIKKNFSLSKLQDVYKKAQSVEADFTQEFYRASLANTKTSKGSIKLSKPANVRWEIYEPEASVMVCNGKKLQYFHPDARGKGKGQVIERSPNELTRQPIFRILSGQSPLDKEFSVVKTETEKDITNKSKLTAITLKPKKSMGDLAQVTLKVNANYLISELNLEHTSGNKTRIALQNQTLGAKLPSALFEFKPPEGTEVVRNTEE